VVSFGGKEDRGRIGPGRIVEQIGGSSHAVLIAWTKSTDLHSTKLPPLPPPKERLEPALAISCEQLHTVRRYSAADRRLCVANSAWLLGCDEHHANRKRRDSFVFESSIAEQSKQLVWCPNMTARNHRSKVS
jgi:hypothetical protein